MESKNKVLKTSLLLIVFLPFLHPKNLNTKFTNDFISDNDFHASKKLTTLFALPSQCVYQCRKLSRDKTQLRKFHNKSNKCECFQVSGKMTDSRKKGHLMQTGALFLVDCEFVSFLLWGRLCFYIVS